MLVHVCLDQTFPNVVFRATILDDHKGPHAPEEWALRAGDGEATGPVSYTTTKKTTGTQRERNELFEWFPQKFSIINCGSWWFVKVWTCWFSSTNCGYDAISWGLKNWKYLAKRWTTRRINHEKPNGMMATKRNICMWQHWNWQPNNTQNNENMGHSPKPTLQMYHQHWVVSCYFSVKRVSMEG